MQVRVGRSRLSNFKNVESPPLPACGGDHANAYMCINMEIVCIRYNECIYVQANPSISLPYS